mmetsp:Transcript_6139/g.8249  ORF Transcript_6139/g.8249 Transcript_6139/m.8249 type:complete len:86 (-) Transcript_6139:488-745(-)
MGAVLQQLVLVGVWVLSVDVFGVRARHIPRQVPFPHEIKQDNAERLEVISARMLVTFVAIQRQVLGGANDAFIFFERDMSASFGA